jgi:phosphotransferase system  glucose/maltose/N-acetylglucosamine-specific IIC component
MKSQTIFGICFIIVSIPMLLIPAVGWIYGPIVFLIGLFLIIFRNAESKIEQIKEPNKEYSKKSSKQKSKGGNKK